MLIGILLAVLVVQYVANEPDPDRLIDPATCEIYTQDAPGGGSRYSGEFDQKCMEWKNLASP